jgi:beta-lactamase superfamily II metal-dependent hydrolase
MSATFPLSPLSLADARRPFSQRQPAALPATVNMVLRIWDVEHGACAMLHPTFNGVAGRLAMIDSGCTKHWHPSRYIRNELNRQVLDYLFITNADQDHLSDLNGLWDYGINVPTLYRNRRVSPADLRLIKLLQCGTLTNDIERFLSIHETYTGAVTYPFDTSMGGITVRTFQNSYPAFTDTNNLSLVVFFKFAGFKILFPGDMEKDGWEALIERQDFRDELAGTTVLCASHHGRDNGFCDDIFNYCTPQAVVISDKPIMYETQRTVPDYRAVTPDDGVVVRTTGKRRHVLTTRRDGHITFIVRPNGNYFIDTEYQA